LMIWGDETGKPLDWQDAARSVNITARSMRKSLERPAVRSYLLEQNQVLRACLSAKSLSRLDELAAQRSNMNAAVAAIRVIDEGEQAAERPPGSATPGVVIRVVNVIQQQAPAVDRAVPPLTIEHEARPTVSQTDGIDD